MMTDREKSEAMRTIFAIMATFAILALVSSSILGNIRWKRIEKACQEAGYFSFDAINRNVVCVGIQDGEMFYVPLEDVKAGLGE